LSIVIGSIGIAWMFGQEAGRGISLAGTAVALLVPLAAAINWTLLQHISHDAGDPDKRLAQDMLPAALIGALLSAAITLPFAYPLQSSYHDLSLLAMLASCSSPFHVCWWCVLHASCRRRRLRCSACSKLCSALPGRGSVLANGRQPGRWPAVRWCLARSSATRCWR
jgi:hypothetical protein